VFSYSTLSALTSAGFEKYSVGCAGNAVTVMVIVMVVVEEVWYDVVWRSIIWYGIV